MVSRLSELRKEMKKKKLDGVLVPRTDAFLGEYIPPSEERLAWISGFDGSAGIALILKKQAFLLTDGRYLLQAEKQIKGKGFTLKDSGATSMAALIAKTMKKGARLGIDTRLHSITEIEKLAPHAKILPLTPNPIDRIWHRPKMKKSMVEAHPLTYAGKSTAEKTKQIAADMNADILLITDQSALAWLLNIRGRDVPHTPFALSFALFEKKRRQIFWFIEKNRLTHDTERHITIMPPTKLATQLKALAKKKAKIQLDPRHTPFWFMSKMKGADIIKAPCPIEKAKACKNSTEQRGARKAHFYDGLACIRFLYWLEKNWRKTSELEAAQKLEALRRQEKALMDLSFETISASGANGAIIHYRVSKKSNRQLKAGELYLCDSGGQYKQGTTDITRTIALGKAGKEEKQNFTHVLQGHIALARAYFPENTSGAQLDALARSPLWSAGLDFAHGTGHGVGSFLSVHEGPQIISKHGTYPLQKGMIISNEPGYYKKGRYGIRIESLLLVKQAKAGFLHFETLSLAPIDKRLILKTQLQPNERTWLNEYHAHIYKTLAPHLEPKVKQWLQKACLPI